MSLRKSFSLVAPIACMACLAVGYTMTGEWVGLVVSLVAWPVWLVAWRRPSDMPPSIPFVFSVGIAAGGLLAGAAPLMMILGAVLALASWDLVQLDHSLTGSSSSSAATMALFEKRHFQYLALALVSGLLMAVTGRLIHFRVPFGIVVILAIITLFGLDRIVRTLIGER